LDFEYKESDSDLERNKKDTAKLIYSPDRFKMQKMHATSSLFADQIVQFVKECLNGESKHWWESEKVPAQKWSQKVVGEDFKVKVWDSKQPVLALITHHHKNGDLEAKFEELARQGIEGVKCVRVRGVNENEVYRWPSKLPALVLFKKGSEGVEPVQYEGVEKELLKKTSSEETQERVKEFVKRELN